jgi:hypothetical protein
MYSPTIVERAIGPVPVSNLTNAQTDVLVRPASIRTIKLNNGDHPTDASNINGILSSRIIAATAYTTLLNEMIAGGKELRIRCIAGTDIFNSQRTGDQLLSRVTKETGHPKVLLLYPFGHAAQIRSAAEGERKLSASQFSRDARSTFEFITARKVPAVHAKWIDIALSSLLIWTAEYALVEPYDLGREDKTRVGCIGRHAPVIVVAGGTAYHTSLKNGFDYVFDGKFALTGIRTFSIQEIAKHYKRA